MPPRVVLTILLGAAAATTAAATPQQSVFKAGVDVVTVTVTVTDENGRFVSGLQKDDFLIYDEGEPQEIVTFSSERVPVSLGVVLDISGSMTDDKMAAARAAIDRFTYDLLGPDDELFLAEFGSATQVLQTWTVDRGTFSRALDRTRRGHQRFGTALFDAIRETIDVAASGAHSKKALLIMSDGQDTRSRTPIRKVQEIIRASEVLVYALGVDDGPIGRRYSGGVNTGTLRALTDETGGRTETVRGFVNLDDATRRLADELNRQYVIGYATPGLREGKWRRIKVDVPQRRVIVRARSGYIAN
jgi:Ca-activated chloride channel family protein